MKAIEEMLEVDRSMCDIRLDSDKWVVAKPKEFNEFQFRELTKKIPQNIIDLYNKLDQYINVLNIKWYHVIKYTTNVYVWYMLEGWRQFLWVRFTWKWLNCYCIHWTYTDPLNKISEKTSYDRTTDMHIAVNNDFDLDYAKWIIEQSYEKAIK